MSDSYIALTTAGIAAIVTIAGWNISHYLAKKREDRTRRIESTVAIIEKEIEEFYGPLRSLIEQVHSVWRIRKKLIDGTEHKQYKVIDDFVWVNYFTPLHIELRDLIKSKSYVVKDKDLKNNIREYLEHSIQELFQERLIREQGIATDQIGGTRWPRGFLSSVETVIQDLSNKRNKLIQNLDEDNYYA